MWEFFLLFYSILVVGYLWYRYGLIFSSREFNYSSYTEMFSVIVPVYNEDPRYLYDCLLSIIKARGNKEVIVVNDGSTKKETLDCLDLFGDYVTVLHQKNKGKRRAQALGIEHATGEIIVTVDSDTIVKKGSLLELLRPFNDKEVGGATGNIILANKNQNFLTRLINSMYWTSFNIDRNGTAGFSYMPVCSGALAAYRKELLVKLMPLYLSQRFLGSKCHVGDDRFLTINIQKRLGYRIEYAKKAVAHTFSPYTLGRFIKQLVRWKQSVIRETLIFWKGASKSKLLFFDIWFNFFISVLSIFIRLHILFLIIIEPLFFINFIITLIALASVFSIYMFFYNRGEFIYKIFYSILNETVLWIAFPLAVFNLHKQGKWGTR